MPGFANDAANNSIMWSDNLDFSGNVIPGRAITTNGQLLIGSTTAPNIQTGILTSPLGTISIGYSTPNITLDASATASLLITTFSTSGTWTVNPRTKYAEFFMWGAGGGGGSGRCGASGAASGGGGGGAGAFAYQISQASSLASGPYTITVGTGGAGGASVNAILTNGNIGIAGGNSSIGSIFAVGGGPPGGGGTTSFIAGGAGGISATLNTSNPSGSQGGRGENTSPGFPGADLLFGASTSGGGGGGFTAVTPSIGGTGGNITDSTATILVAAGAPVSGAAGGNGNSPVNKPLTIGGTGGAGGGSDGVSVSGNGGIGGSPGAGGGGGAGALSSSPSGTGGNGSNGLVIIIEHF